MKKILILFATLMMMPVIAEAQIVVKERTKVETIKKLRMGWVSLDKTGTSYFLCVRSDNQFDDTYTIHLGQSKEDAIASLNTLIEVAKTLKKDESVKFDNINEELSIYSGVLKKEIWFKSQYRAGWGKVSKMELNTLLDALLFANNN